jgi:hypothetical protein
MPLDIHAVRYLGPFFWAAPFALAPLAWRIGARWFMATLTPYLVVATIGGWIAFGPAVDGIWPRRYPRGIAQDEMTLRDYLRARELRYGAADYWLAYRLTFLFDENPIITPLELISVRYPMNRRLFQEAPRVVLIFHPSAPRAPFEEVERGFRQLGAPHEVAHVAGFDLIIFNRYAPGKAPPAASR